MKPMTAGDSPVGAMPSLVSRFSKVFAQLAASAPERYELRVNYEIVGTGREWDISLIPQRSAHAKVNLHLAEGFAVVNLTLGVSTPFEFMLPNPSEISSETAREIEELARAAVSGALTEDLWFKGEKLVRAKGTVQLEHGPESSSWGDLAGFPWLGLRHEHRTY